MKNVLLIPAALMILCAPNLAQAQAPAAPQTAAFPAGDYKLDKNHASLTFQVSHMGFSHYTARFVSFDAALKLDPAHPDQASVTASIDPQSLELNANPPGFHDELLSKPWLDGIDFPKMTFVSTAVVMTGANTARITGNLTLRGVTKPVVLDAIFNGGYAGMPVYDPQARVGFSAHGTLKRSDFGISFGIPAPGSNMGVGDAVDFTIEAEFSGPALKPH